MKGHYHINRVEPQIDPPGPWPRGGWSLYQITGDQIAQRIRFGGGGEVIRRDSWCGYIGMWETLSEVMAAIEEVEAKP